MAEFMSDREPLSVSVVSIIYTYDRTAMLSN